MKNPDDESALDPADDPVGDTCPYIHRDALLRFLGKDPKAGLPFALKLAKSQNPDMRSRAAVILSDIDDSSAKEALQALTQDSDSSVAMTAKYSSQSQPSPQ
jgi:hypothetical protein